MAEMYRKLGLAIALNTVLMYLITYVNLADLAHFENNINRVYMALLMAAPMLIVMLLVMRSMYPDRKLNLALQLGAVGTIALLITLIRTQTPVGDGQFLRSMIPHHSSAIVMCEEASLSNPEIIALCREIVQTQREEIALMKEIQARL